MIVFKQMVCSEFGVEVADFGGDSWSGWTTELWEVLGGGRCWPWRSNGVSLMKYRVVLDERC